MRSKEAGKTLLRSVADFFIGMPGRIKAGPPLMTPEEINASEIVSRTGQLKQRQQYGNDNFSRENIPNLFLKLDEKGYFRAYEGINTVNQSDNGNIISGLVDTTFEVTVEGIKKGPLSLIIAGRRSSISDPHYLIDMIPREVNSIRKLLLGETIDESDLHTFYGHEPTTEGSKVNYGRLTDPVVGLIPIMEVVKKGLIEQGRKCGIYPICDFRKFAIVDLNPFTVKINNGIFDGKPFISTVPVCEVLTTVEREEERVLIINGDFRVDLDLIDKQLPELILQKVGSGNRPIHVMNYVPDNRIIIDTNHL